jgi:recombination protein RecA
MPAKKAATKTTSRAPAGAKKATASAIAKFEEEFGKGMGVALKAGAKRPRAKITSTGSMNLDFALTVGGVPSGRIIELWGPEHAGKTTLAIIMARMHQIAYPDQMVAWVDMEQTFDDDWADDLGLDRSRMWFYTPQTAEDVSDAVKKFVRSGLCSFVSLDSVGGMISRLEMEKDADEATVGKVPGIVTRMVKASSPMAFANGTTLCVINQVRANIGGWGPDEDTGGGWALKHVTTMKMQVKKAGGEGTRHMAKVGGHEKPIPVGYKMAVRVQKNKMGPEGVVAEMWFHNVATSTFGPIGFDAVQEIFDFAKRFKLMGSGAGGNYEVEGEKIKGGETKVMEYLRQNPDVVQALREKVLEQVSHLAQDDDTPPDVGSDDPLGMAEMA